MNEQLAHILSAFPTDGAAVSCERYGCGHINETYLAVTERGHRYILQKINDHVFPDVPALMENIASVTSFLKKQATDERSVLTLLPTLTGGTCHREPDGGWWRLYEFVEDSICLQAPETPADFYESAVAFGSFQQQLASFPAGSLHETIRNFHNTSDRMRIFRETLGRDPLGRAAAVQKEIDFVLAREEEAGALIRAQKAGELPLRVTHNDTKLNNVLLDDATGEGICVIDLDTVMPGLALYDFGDMVRTATNSAPEDEPDVTKVHMRMPMFEALVRGYLASAGGFLNATEKELLPFSGKLLTFECAIRFLTDYLQGDVYFKTRRPGQNLDRCRSHFKLVESIEEQHEAMLEVVRRW